MRTFPLQLGAALIAANACFLAPAANAQIALEPTAVSGEARMVTYEYDEDRTYRVLVRPKNNTQIKLAKDERATYVSAGDSANFTITVPASKEFVLVKPKFEAMATNLMIVTTRRTYHIDLLSTAENKKWYMRVAWQYGDGETIDVTDAAAAPERLAGGAGSIRRLSDRVAQAVPIEESDLVAGVKPESLTFGYSIKGDADFRPTQVFDDGIRTYIRMPDRLQELPALFMTDSDGEVQLVNYSPRPPYLVAQRVMPKFVLKLGKSEVSIERERAKKSWFSRWSE